jgi:hypothetical protein
MSAPALYLANEIEAAHQLAIGAARTAIQHAVACGKLLIEAKAQVAHGEWLPWVEEHLSFGDRQARKYMALAANAEQLAYRNCGSDLGINAALELIASPKTSHSLRVMGSSESPEWYTPPHIFELAVATLGEVDLDPCWHARSPVAAQVTFTARQDGLNQPWAGRVFLNPPYGREIEAWLSKLVLEYNSGAVSEAIALVPARVDTDWFRLLDPFVRCFVDGRLTFVNAEHPAPFPSAVVYLGRNVRYFARVFGEIGGIWTLFDGAAP